MRIYLAGPMRGRPMHNFPLFMQVAMELREQGHVVLNPAEQDIAQSFDYHREDAPFDLAAAFEWDFNAVLRSEAIVLLPGWQQSAGAAAEVIMAANLGKHIHEWREGLLIKLAITGYDVEFNYTEAPAHER